jgi:radical SAM superfamily enzyme YgiQ (UPF0313 family)
MSVVLVYPPNYFKEGTLQKEPYGGIEERWGKAPPLGILYLAAALLKSGVEVRIVDLNSLKLGLKEGVDLIAKSKPRVIGISATSFQLRGAVQLAERLKEELENVLIGLGGVHISVDPDFINRFSVFDFGLVGEGEITFPSIVTRILKGEKVKGVFYGQLPTILDELSPPARQLIDETDYFSEQKFATILATRGCPYNCIFCSIKGLRGQKVRFRSPTNVADEMQQVRDMGIKRFWFVDDTFAVNRQYVFRLCEEIINRKLDVEWWCETRVESIDETLLKVMRKAGCIQISFGIESGSERVRINAIRKNFTNDQAVRAFKLCKKFGISTEAYLMMGFPTETVEDLYSTANFPAQLGADIIGVHITQILPGSDLFTLAVKEGRIVPNIYDQYAKGMLKGALPVYVPDGLSLSILKSARKKAYRKFYFRPKFLMRRLTKDLRSFEAFKNDIRMALKLYLEGKTFAEPE